MLDIKPRTSYKLGVIICIYLGYEGLTNQVIEVRCSILNVVAFHDLKICTA